MRTLCQRGDVWICCRGEAGHKCIAKLPGRNTNRHQDTFGIQVADNIRLKAFYQDGSVESSSTGREAVAGGEQIENLTARTKTMHSGTVNFLAGAETVNISPLLPKAIPKAKDRWVAKCLVWFMRNKPPWSWIMHSACLWSKKPISMRCANVAESKFSNSICNHHLIQLPPHSQQMQVCLHVGSCSWPALCFPQVRRNGWDVWQRPSNGKLFVKCLGVDPQLRFFQSLLCQRRMVLSTWSSCSATPSQSISLLSCTFRILQHSNTDSNTINITAHFFWWWAISPLIPYPVGHWYTAFRRATVVVWQWQTNQ